jgi:hypothetical protein
MSLFDTLKNKYLTTALVLTGVGATGATAQTVSTSQTNQADTTLIANAAPRPIAYSGGYAASLQVEAKESVLNKAIEMYKLDRQIAILAELGRQGIGTGNDIGNKMSALEKQQKNLAESLTPDESIIAAQLAPKNGGKNYLLLIGAQNNSCTPSVFSNTFYESPNKNTEKDTSMAAPPVKPTEKPEKPEKPEKNQEKPFRFQLPESVKLTKVQLDKMLEDGASQMGCGENTDNFVKTYLKQQKNTGGPRL